MMKTTLLIFNAVILSIGNTAGPLLIRLYFLRGGKRKWLSSWLETGGWPIILIPLSISYIHRRRRSKEGDGAAAKVFLIKPGLFAACVVLGFLTGLDDYMYAYGSSLLPVSTSALLISSQLAFQAAFALLIVKHKFTPFSINALVLLTVGALILGLHTNGDRPANESQKEYFAGFFMMLGAAALYGCVLPLIELAYMKAKQSITYTLVMEVQLVIGFFATAFCTVGMLVNNDFKAISKEGREFELGEAKYYILLVSSAIIWQCFFLGAVGVIATSSSIHAGVLIAVLIPVTELFDQYLKSLLYSKTLCSSSVYNKCAGKVEIKYYRLPGFNLTGPAKRNGSSTGNIYPGYSRVNHGKYAVSDVRAHIGTSNLIWDYFYTTAGVSFGTYNPAIVSQLQEIFEADWNSPYALAVEPLESLKAS
ncbi:hypothetical protein AAC387_Pa04g2862 [Persea americana]